MTQLSFTHLKMFLAYHHKPCEALTFCLRPEKKTVSYFVFFVCVALQKHYQPIMAHRETKHQDLF